MEELRSERFGLDFRAKREDREAVRESKGIRKNTGEGGGGGAIKERNGRQRVSEVRERKRERERERVINMGVSGVFLGV